MENRNNQLGVRRFDSRNRKRRTVTRRAIAVIYCLVYDRIKVNVKIIIIINYKEDVASLQKRMRKTKNNISQVQVL